MPNWVVRTTIIILDSGEKTETQVYSFEGEQDALDLYKTFKTENIDPGTKREIWLESITPIDIPAPGRRHLITNHAVLTRSDDAAFPTITEYPVVQV